MTKTIHTYNPKKDIWSYISKFTNEYYVRNFLSQRIKSNFYDLQFGELKKMKDPYDNNVETYESIEENDVNNSAGEIVLTAKQALEFYRASSDISLQAKPIVLYYSFTSLARIVFLSTYKDSDNLDRKHGLEFKSNRIICRKKGFFARFHDCYSADPSIYLNQCEFKWKDLLVAAPVERIGLFENMRTKSPINISSKNNAVQIDEMTREFLFSYAISMLARYNIVSWGQILAGKDSDRVWEIERYVDNIEMFFPNLLLNLLLGEDHYFYPETRLD